MVPAGLARGPARAGCGPRSRLLRNGSPRTRRANWVRTTAELLHDGGAWWASGELILLPPRRRPLPATESSNLDRLPSDVVPAGLEPGDQVVVEEPQFELLLSQPVEFPLYVSTTRTTDRPGQLVPVQPEQLSPLIPLRTVLKTRKRHSQPTTRVRLYARLTEIGTLDLWCAECQGKNSWKLQFDVRKSFTSEEDRQAGGSNLTVLEESTWLACEEVLRDTFGAEGNFPPEGVIKRLASALGMDRDDWPATLLRRMWEALIDLEQGRRKAPPTRPDGSICSALCCARLRCPVGRLACGRNVASSSRQVGVPGPLCRSEWLVMWRRIAGGPFRRPSAALADPLLGASVVWPDNFGPPDTGICLSPPTRPRKCRRLLGRWSTFPFRPKPEIGSTIIRTTGQGQAKSPAALPWLGSGTNRSSATDLRSLESVVAPEVAAEWLEKLLKLARRIPPWQLAVMQASQTYRRSPCDLPERLRNRADWLRKTHAPDHFVELVTVVRTVGKLESKLPLRRKLPLGSADLGGNVAARRHGSLGRGNLNHRHQVRP